MKFSFLAKEFYKLSNINSRNTMIEHLAELLKQANVKEAEIICYFSLGQLRAIYKSTQFNFADKSIAKVVASILDQDTKEFNKAVNKAGSIAQAIRESNWPYQDTGVTLTEIYEKLVKLEETSGSGSQEEKANILNNILKQLDSLSASYIVAIILGALRMGFSDMTLLDAFSFMLVGNKSLKKEIERAYNVRADIGQIITILKTSGIEKLKELKPEIGIPIRPAGAERLNTAQAIIEKIGPCYAEPKLDGFRLQVHLKRVNNTQKIWFYSRNMHNMSDIFPDLVKAFKSCDHEQVILEGEAIVYDEQTNTFLPFQQTVKRKRKHGIEKTAQEYPLRLYLFDILDLNNQDTMNLPYIERHQLLEKLFSSCNNTIKVNPNKKCDTAQELKDYFLKEISEGLEGLVVKRPDAPYTPGKRNYNWIKLKRTQEGELTDTVDAIVMGYNAGGGRRAEFGIGSFLVGVYNQNLDEIQTIAKVGTGLTDVQFKELKSKLDKIRVSEKPENYQVSKELVPDVWVAPNIVVEIEAEEITKSPMHTAGKSAKDNTGFALRFPRFLRYRDDKDIDQATTVKEVQELYNLQYKKNKKV